MSVQPTIAWVTRGVRAALEEQARVTGAPLEEVAGDMLAEAVRSRALPTPDLPDLAQPTSAEQRAARDRASAELMLAATGRNPKAWRDGGDRE
ncbi:hypothetical protein [Paraburkholderia sacchari]|uniref:hypothetical protein n=1 Tax=Paraburkholderia sacchari TaxID=159450 RepID=UPI0005420C4D|nr:hypothetical protein [Paraburkholderia sacchari]NLP64348.1 hypothetical protein [Paraburkholderia sacchari]